MYEIKNYKSECYLKPDSSFINENCDVFISCQPKLKREYDMEFTLMDRRFGRDAHNLVNETGMQNYEGAVAALETFYYSFNNKDLEIFNKIWTQNCLIQLNNPLGGIIRGINDISNLYRKLFTSNANVWVEFSDIVSYELNDCVVFAGREKGAYSNAKGTVELNIRTTRIFAYINGTWGQLHHHGSIDDPELLQKYQAAVK